RGRPQRLRSARNLLQGQQHPWSGTRVPAGPRHRSAAGLSGRGKQPAGAAVQRIGLDPARHLFRLSRRVEVGRTRAGVPRFRGEQGATLAVVMEGFTRAVSSEGDTGSREENASNIEDPGLRMTDMRLGCLLQGTRADHSLITEIS